MRISNKKVVLLLAFCLLLHNLLVVIPVNALGIGPLKGITDVSESKTEEIMGQGEDLTEEANDHEMALQESYGDGQITLAADDSPTTNFDVLDSIQFSLYIRSTDGLSRNLNNAIVSKGERIRYFSDLTKTGPSTNGNPDVNIFSMRYLRDAVGVSRGTNLPILNSSSGQRTFTASTVTGAMERFNATPQVDLVLNQLATASIEMQVSPTAMGARSILTSFDIGVIPTGVAVGGRFTRTTNFPRIVVDDPNFTISLENNDAISGVGFSIQRSEVGVITEGELRTLSGATAHNIDTGLPVGFSLDASTIVRAAGQYPVTLITANGTERIILVTVIDDRNSFDVNFNLNGGGITTKVVLEEELIPEPPVPTRTGYSFVGWNTVADGSGVTWDFTTMLMPANNVTLYAQWTVNSYEVSFNVNGGNGVAPIPQTLNFGTLLSEPTVPTRTGYSFVGWNTVADGSGSTWNFTTTTMPANNVMLYAQWTVNSYEVSFDVNGGNSVPPVAQTLNFGTLLSEPTVPTRTGYSFVGWNTVADGSGSIWNFTTTTMPANNVILYAQWTVNSYEVSFDVNGGYSDVPATQELNFGALVSEPVVPTRRGHSFVGWNTAENGSGSTWNFVTTTMPANNVILYAQWTVNSYEVSFDVNGGDSIPPVTQTANFGTLVSEPVPATRTGHSFVGWNTVADGSGVSWNFLINTVPENGIMLYAQWTPNTYELDFNVNGGKSSAPTGQSIVYGTLATTVLDPTRIGHTFIGWNTAQDGSGMVWNFLASTMPATDTVLYAQWTINSYELSFDVNGGESIAPANQQVEYKALATRVNAPIRSGHVFIGWNTEQDGSGITWSFSTTLMSAADTVLYAQWDLDIFNLHFNLNGGEGEAPASQEVLFGMLAGSVANPVRTGHTFKDWNTAEDGSGITWDFDTTIMPIGDVILYAQWTVNIYTIDFNLNGGDGIAQESQQIVFDTLVTPVTNPTRIGHTFIGWNTAQDNSGVTWNFSDSLMPASNVTLYAQWFVDSFNLNFNLNGGDSIQPQGQVVEFDALAIAINDPDREGATFIGWSSTSDGSGTMWDFNTTRMPANNVMLYAQWTVNSYEVSFDVNGGDSVAPLPQTLNFGSLVSEPAVPTRMGYSFVGWNTTADGSGVTWDFETMEIPANNVTLYAQWTVNSYEVSFDVNGGNSVPPVVQTLNFGELVSEPAVPTRTGYSFVGWNTVADGSGSTWNFATTTTPANNVTLYAQWTVNSYEVSFDVNGGGSVAPVAQTLNFGSLLSEPAIPTRTGYRFVEWNTVADGSGSTWNFASTTIPANNVTLYAQWTVNSYEVSFDVNGGDSVPPIPQTPNFGSLLSEPAVPTRTGYSFVGWNTAADGSGSTWNFATTTMVANNVTLYAQWTVNSYEVSFDVNGGGSVAPVAQTLNFGSLLSEPAVPTRTGYSFVGWNTVADGSGSTWNFATTTIPANNVTLYAQWTVNSYEVSFDVNGGGSFAPVPQTINFGALVSEPAVPIRTGHSFVGWNTVADGSGSTWNFATTTMPTNNVTLYAQWTLNSYEVSFNVNGGNSIVPVSQTLNFGTLVSEPAVPIRTGHSFVGWSTVADGSGSAWNFATTVMPANNVMLYAQWTVNSYEVSFDVNGGNSVAPVPQTLNFGLLVSEPAVPTRTGYSFVGWNTATDGSGGTWNFATTVMPANNVTLYAQWTVNSYEVSFDVNGGNSVPPVSQTLNFGTLLSEPAVPTRTGHSFVGWNTAADGSGSAWNFVTTTMPANNVMLYAQWTVNSYEVRFDVNGGDSVPPATQTPNFGELVSEPVPPTRTGHSFVGWNTAADGSGVSWNFLINTVQENGITLYAQWTPNAYNLNFNVNGGKSLTPTGQSIVYGTLATTVLDPTRIGHTFIGWNTAQDGSGMVWNFLANTMPATDTVLYAQWTINSYELSFDVNGGESIAPANQQVEYKALATRVNVPIRSGHVFIGWNTAQDGSGITWSFSTTPMSAADTVLYAQWDLDIFNLHFNLNGGEGEAPASQEVLFGMLAGSVANPVRTGYTFKDWNTAEDGSGITWDFDTTIMPVGDVILYAQWTVNIYTIDFNLNGGDGIAQESQQIVFDTLVTPVTNPTRIGHTFIGWNTAQDNSGVTWNFSDSLMPASNVTLYAQWSINSFNLNFNLNGGDSIQPQGQVVEFDALAIAINDPEREGSTFIGWSSTSDGSGTMWDFNTTRMPANNVLLYAQWTVNSYEVSFDVNGGDSVAPLPQTLNFGSLVSEPAVPTRMGYSFVGWNTTADGSGVTWDFETMKMSANNVTLYAQWTVNSYEVSFDVNGGNDVPPVAQTLNFGSLVSEPAVPTRIGHRFVGWSITRDSGAQTLWDFATTPMPATNVTLYAQWQQVAAPTLRVPQFTEVTLNGIFYPKVGVDAIDGEGKNITANVKVDNTVDTSKAGIYLVQYDVTDVFGNVSFATQVVLVNDGKYVHGDNYIITAVDFRVEESAANLMQEEMQKLAHVQVYDIVNMEWIEQPTIQTDSTNFQAKEGVYSITFKFNPSITIQATVYRNEQPVLPVTGENQFNLIASMTLLLSGVSILTVRRKIKR